MRREKICKAQIQLPEKIEKKGASNVALTRIRVPKRTD